MSERVGSDIQYAAYNDAEIEDGVKFRVVLCQIRLFPTLISKIKWLESELPFNILKLGKIVNEHEKSVFERENKVTGTNAINRGK